MLFKSKGIQNIFNYFPLKVQAFIKCLTFKVVLSFLQLIVYLGLITWLIFKAFK